MERIVFENPHRQRHFDFFRRMDQPHFGTTVNVDITEFAAHIRARADWRFTPALVYLITRTAIEIPSFCWRIRGEEVVGHATLSPSFAVPTKGTDVFSFCTVPYNTDPKVFHAQAVEVMEEMYNNPSFEDEHGRDDYLFLSSFPWASFTSVTHAMHYSPGDSVPRIAWGKYFKQDDRLLMPLAVQAHHALVDGRNLGEYYQLIEQYLKKSEKIFT